MLPLERNTQKNRPLVLFDPNSIIDHATFEKPHQYATGVEQVFVNGIQVLKDGKPTGKAAGRFVRRE